MARVLEILKPIEVERLLAGKKSALRKPGRHFDGGGLALVVDPFEGEEGPVAARWVFIYREKKAGGGAGRKREMGLGSLRAVSLKRAREKALEQRALLADGADPIAGRRAAQAVPTFGEMADSYIKTRSGEGRSEKSVARWRRALEVHAAVLRSKPINKISTADVLEALKPIWTKIPPNAKLARGYIEAVLDAAKAQGFRQGENPARWQGHLASLLARPAPLQRGHLEAMPFGKVPAFMTVLSEKPGMGAKALRFIILTASRSGEALGARWSEVDLEAAVWTVPAERMKAGREHRVPLSPAAIAILDELAPARMGGLIFPGVSPEKPMGSLIGMIRRMGVAGVTVHGFRSSFRDWTGEMTTFPREVAEAALAHRIGDAAEQAYRRGDSLAKRRKLMDAWSAYCRGEPGKVIALVGRAS